MKESAVKAILDLLGELCEPIKHNPERLAKAEIEEPYRYKVGQFHRFNRHSTLPTPGMVWSVGRRASWGYTPIYYFVDGYVEGYEYRDTIPGLEKVAYNGKAYGILKYPRDIFGPFLLLDEESYNALLDSQSWPGYPQQANPDYMDFLVSAKRDEFEFLER